MSGIQDYDYLVLFPKGTLAGGIAVAIVSIGFLNAPASLRITTIVVGITYGLFSFSIGLIPWWLFVKQVISMPHRSRHQISIVQGICHTFLMIGVLAILFLWLFPALYMAVNHIGEGTIRLEVPSLLPLGIVLLVNLVGLLSMYSYVKIRKRF